MSESLSNTYQDNTSSQLHHLNQFGPAEAQIIYQLNKFRFKSKPIIAKLKNVTTAMFHSRSSRRGTPRKSTSRCPTSTSACTTRTSRSSTGSSDTSTYLLLLLPF